MEFTKATLWVQIHGLPSHCRTKNMATKIGATLGEVMDTSMFQMPDKSLIMKAYVMFDFSHKIKRGANVGSKKNGVLWVDFKKDGVLLATER